jgi:ribonucleoside-diphosphate reductase beta chain
VPLGEDCRDWAQKLTDHERNLLTQIFRFFTQADVEVQDCYHEKYGRVFKPTEIKMMLTAFSNMETVHIAAYSHLLDTIGMPETEYAAFLQYKEMKDKHDYLATFGVDTDEDIAKTLAMFGGFTEGLQLFASFAMLMNFPRFNKMKGMGQIVSWSVRDESLHCEGIIKMFHAFCQERNCLTPSVRDDILDMCQKTVRIEDAFIDLVFEMGPVKRMTPKEIKKYVRYIADWRLGQLGMKPIYMIEEHPLPGSPAAQRRRARQLLRDPRDGVFEGSDAWCLERSVGLVRQAPEGEGPCGQRGRRRRGRGGYVLEGGDCGGVIVRNGNM